MPGWHHLSDEHMGSIRGGIFHCHWAHPMTHTNSHSYLSPSQLAWLVTCTLPPHVNCLLPHPGLLQQTTHAHVAWTKVFYRHLLFSLHHFPFITPCFIFRGYIIYGSFYPYVIIPWATCHFGNSVAHAFSWSRQLWTNCLEIKHRQFSSHILLR